jgi:hypothetical protein
VMKDERVEIVGNVVKEIHIHLVLSLTFSVVLGCSLSAMQIYYFLLNRP